MDIQDTNFPAYRKYKNNKSYFKIINAESFEEIRFIGSKKIISHTQAVQFPEKSFIRDLLYNYSGIADEISAEEYNLMA